MNLWPLIIKFYLVTKMITHLARRNTRLCCRTTVILSNQTALFSSDNSDHTEDDNFVKFTKTIEKFKDLVDPEDQRIDPSESETINEILRTNHLAKKVLARHDVQDHEYGGYREESLKELESQMPDSRTRPSLMSDVLPCAFGAVNQFNKAILPPSLYNKFQSAIEVAVQEENDEQLRILNEKKIENQE